MGIETAIAVSKLQPIDKQAVRLRGCFRLRLRRDLASKSIKAESTKHASGMRMLRSRLHGRLNRTPDLAQ